MTVGVLRVELILGDSASLKDKRRAVKSLKDRIRGAFNVSVAEVDHQDKWQRTALAVAMVGTDGPFVSGGLNSVVSFIGRDPRLSLASHEMEIMQAL
jgi:uncharacterized protein YlxP (DUF503 family)